MEDKPTLEKISVSTAEADLKKLVETTVRDIVKNSKTAKPQVPELVFKKYFLVTFATGCEQTGLPEEYTAGQVIKAWINLSGTPYSEVDVIDEKGNVLFTTPGLYGKPNTDAIKANMTGVVDTFKRKSNVMETIGIEYLKGELNSAGKDITVDMTDNLVRWKAIFDRYFKPVDSDKNKVIENTTDDDFFNYD